MKTTMNPAFENKAVLAKAIELGIYEKGFRFDDQHFVDFNAAFEIETLSGKFQGMDATLAIVKHNGVTLSAYAQCGGQEAQVDAKDVPAFLADLK